MNCIFVCLHTKCNISAVQHPRCKRTCIFRYKDSLSACGGVATHHFYINGGSVLHLTSLVISDSASQATIPACTAFSFMYACRLVRGSQCTTSCQPCHTGISGKHHVIFQRLLHYPLTKLGNYRTSKLLPFVPERYLQL